MSGIRLWSTCPDCHKDYPMVSGHASTDCTAHKPDDVPTCVYCGHPIEDHGTTEIGCNTCSCGHDADWHGDE